MQNITTLIDLLFVVTPILIMAGVLSRQVRGYRIALGEAEIKEEVDFLRSRLYRRVATQWLIVITATVVLYSLTAPAFRSSNAVNMKQIQQVEGGYQETSPLERRDPETMRSGSRNIEARRDTSGSDEVARKRQEVIDKVHREKE